ncbi:PilZ domain-containing protein [Myxococcota bacterium]|nr:PilZ domain-containing protein [Myxococcota bacterium]MBU1381384.1 PilZ domain-containing protein [Myxococcota bacterium]MBU1498430.1 PilZ domain-containing protein [Myxococcota bacterium]
MTNTADQRKHPRYELEAFVDYTGREFLLNRRIYDISLGGLRLQTSEVEEVGREVDLVISFPDLDAVIELKGEVAWKKDDGSREMGIRFKNVGIKEHRLLQEYLKRVS